MGQAFSGGGVFGVEIFRCAGVRLIVQGQREIVGERGGLRVSSLGDSNRKLSSPPARSSGLFSWFPPEGCISFLNDKHDLMQC